MSLALKADWTSNQRMNSRIRHQMLLFCFALLQFCDCICNCLPFLRFILLCFFFFSSYVSFLCKHQHRA